MKRTQYFIAKNSKLTNYSIDETLREYFEKNGDATYLIFEEKWAVTIENGISELFAKTTLKKSEKILNMLDNSCENNVDKYVKYVNDIVEKVNLFIGDRERELKLLEKIISKNKKLEARVGKKQFKIETKKYKNKLLAIKKYFNALGDELEEINKIKRYIKMTDIGDYNFKNKKDLDEWKEALKKKASLTCNYNIKIKKMLNKINKAIKRIIFALQEKILYLIETKYITTKKIIFKAHYKNGEFWYLEKIFDKDAVEVAQVFDKNVKASLLKMSA